MKRRMGFLLETYVLTVLVFIAAKVAFMLYNQAGHDFTVGDVFDVAYHGLSLDLSTALYFLIVPFLVSAVSIWWQGKALGIFLKVYFLLISIAFALAFVADAALYPFWGFKLDASCLQYLESPTEATASVSTLYVAVALGTIAVVATLIFWGYRLILRRFKPTAGTPRRNIMETAAYLLLIPLIVIGIRGGISESTTNIGQVYYSQNQFLNHAAVNPVFSFFYSMSHTMGDTAQYQFMDEQECSKLAAQVYTTESVGSDTLLTTTRPNIIIILMEGAGEEFAEAMPYLQQLKQEGIYFAACYGNSWRTDRGTVCALSGYPSFPSLSVMKMPQKSHTLPSIAHTLEQEGYQTSYLYGGDINFTNMRSYLVATGWEQLISMDDFSASERTSARWGVRDDITFKRLIDNAQCTMHNAQLAAPKKSGKSGKSGDSGSLGDSGGRFLWGFSTLSSHEPWDVPTKTLDDEVLNAFAYLDTCLKNFIEPLKKQPIWEDLLIVLTADHGINYRDIDLSKPMERNHIPMVWVGGAVKEPRRVDLLCNQSDLAATLLGQLRLNHEAFTFSRDVLSTTFRYPTAVHNYNNVQLLIDSTGHILYDFDARQFTIKQSADAERLLRLNKAILQTTTKDLRMRK